MPVKVVTDSTAYLTPEEIRRYDVHVIPLRVIFGSDVYAEGVDITNQEFFRKLSSGHALPTTSQPSVADFTREYRQLTEAGYSILAIHISSKLSGTVGSALAARQALAGADIEIVDARTIALRMLIQPAAEMAAAGAGLAEIKDAIERVNASINTVGMLDTLDYLRKGGRIGRAEALLGTLLRVKPLLDFRGGEVKVVAKLRTSAQAMNNILSFMQPLVGNCRQVCVVVAHIGALTTAQELTRRIKAAFPGAESVIIELGPVLAAHIGPGFFGVGFRCGEAGSPPAG
jgi:DegV family protein with EDD domain